VSKLEHDFFGRNQNPSLPKVSQKKEKKDAVNGDAKNGQDKLRLNFNIVDDEESWYILYLYCNIQIILLIVFLILIQILSFSN